MYLEPIIIPYQLAIDHRVSSTAKLVFAFMSKFHRERQEVFNRDISEILGIERAMLIRIKTDLAKYHYLTKVTDSRGNIKYVLLDPTINVLEKIKQFLKVSTVFRSITALELLTLHPDPAKVLYVMEVYEFTYARSGKKVEKPLFLLKRGLREGTKVTPDKGFVRDWWMIEQQRAGESAAQQRERLKKEAEEREKAAREQKAFDKYLDSLGKKQTEALREHAIGKLKSNGGVPRIGANMVIKIEMLKIWREGSQCQP